MEAPQAEMLTLPTGATHVVWRRSARARRISLRIDPRGGSVIVTLPERASRRAGMALLMDHAGWISDRLAALPHAIALADGALVPLHGTDHRIRHLPEARGGAWIAQGEIVVAGDRAFVSRRVRDLLCAEARRRFGGLAAEKAAAAGVRVARLTVKDQRSRWGSCAANGALAFSWRLVMAPPFVQDYVAGHEIAHLRHMNHGPRFWALVNELTPHRAPAIAWLRREGPRLLRIG